MPTKILAVDNHDVVLLGLRAIFAGTDIALASTAGSAAEAMGKIGEKPDVVLTEVRLDDGDGLGLLKRIRSEYPAQAVIIFSAHDNPVYLARAYASGAVGYVLKREPPRRLIDTVRRATDGDSAWMTWQLKRITGGTVGSSDALLTPRESEVLQQVSHGLTNREIAAVLKISYETVKEHVQHVLRKVGVRDRTQAAVWAVRKEMAALGQA